MAYELYMQVEGEKQGKFKGTSPRKAWAEKNACISYRYGVQSPRDVASGQQSGKRQHEPVTIVKEWDAASPQIFQALVTNEVLKKVTFEFLKTSAKGEEQVYFMVTLTNATVCTLRQMTGGGSGGGEGSAKHTSAKDTMELEEVAFTFDRIDIEDKINGVMAADSWTGN